MIKKNIISKKTLKTVLVNTGLLGDDDPIPAPIDKIYDQSVPKFKTQTHFYGYDGRGSDPTRFDCIYTYNLGQTVFSLIANGATGQMAAILNLEQDFSGWRPIGIPIAPLMHIEERKGKLELVLEKSIVDVNSPAFRVVEALRDRWLAATPEKTTTATRAPSGLRATARRTAPSRSCSTPWGGTFRLKKRIRPGRYQFAKRVEKLLRLAIRWKLQ
jgi:pyrophosphate--fructose-6-phosphate 1-phosphotransferase